MKKLKTDPARGIRIWLTVEDLELIQQALGEHEEKIFSWYKNDHDFNHVECMTTDTETIRRIRKLQKKLEGAQRP